MREYDSYIDETDDFDDWEDDTEDFEELQDEKPSPVNRHTVQSRKERYERSDSTAKKIFRVASNVLFWALCISLVLSSVLFAFSSNPDKSYFGYRTYNVLTDSMTPKEDGSSPPGGFKRGAMIIIEMCKPEDIKVGDIITFNPSTREDEATLYLTHRVVEIKTELGGTEGIFFVTRGDYNDSDDAPISGSMMIGRKVFHIPNVGGVLQWVKENFIFAIFILICLFASIFLFRLYFSKLNKEKQESKAHSGKDL